jgi:potassium-transporting ATPase KdpC subunit
MNAMARPLFVIFSALTLLTGLIYPLAVTGVARLAFPAQAAGSLIVHDGAPQGSALIGQPFSDPRYFWGRPSATGPVPYNGAASSGSNLSPTNPALTASIVERITALRAADPGNPSAVPVDLVTASGSGLDPHISPAAAQWQSARVARIRGLDSFAVERLVTEHTEPRTWGVLGEPRVNVLRLNLALDRLSPDAAAATPRTENAVSQ